jgi:hypothetical protein
MGASTIPAVSAGKTMFRTTLTSGTSYTVPTGVTYLNVTCVGGGGGGASYNDASPQYVGDGLGGQIISSTLSVTAGDSIVYAIGAGGTGAANQSGNTGGSTSFTGATSASGGSGGNYYINSSGKVGQAGLVSPNGGSFAGITSGSAYGGAGGAGCIIIEYWA